MPLNITVTKREIKNNTGLDVSVASYDPAPSLKQVKNYHVVVISRLPFFKRQEHSDTDVVQFMVRREYSAFEKLQKDILVAFPELNFPSFPRKHFMFMSATDMEERVISFDCIVKVIAKDKDMCCSAPMLEFLGFNRQADKNYFKARKKYLQKIEEEAKSVKEKNEKVYGNRSPEDEQTFFGGASSEDAFSDESQTRTQPFTVDSIFEESEDKEKAVKKSAKISVLEDEGEQLLLAGGERSGSSQGNPTGNSLLDSVEDNSELLNVTDTLDDVLKLTNQKKPTAKKVAPVSSSVAKGKGGGLFDLEENTADSGLTSDMGKDDIMKYIQQNQTANDDDLDLF